jgi:signal transduction histidine kinase
VSVAVPSEEIERAWHDWQIAQNRRGLTLALILVMALHPVFALLDVSTAPREAWWVLLPNRAIGELCSLVLFRLRRSDFFARNAVWVTSLYMVSVGASIAVMTAVLGGFESTYYPGLHLVMIGAGLLFVWPQWAVFGTHGAIVLIWFLLNFATEPQTLGFSAGPPIVFVASTAIIASAGQLFAYRQAREQLENRLALERTSTRLATAHDELQRLDRFKSRFFANITHELKTPLAMVLSPIELMVAGELGHLTEPQRATLRSVHNNGARLLKLIGDLLDLSRLEESRLRLRVADHDLVAYLRQLVAQVEPLTTRKNIEVAFTADVERATAWCDLDRMERVFVNLLSNAAKFTPLGGRITVHVTATDAAVTACVSDNGPGFPEDMAERVFERFFQVDGGATHNRQNAGGTGIGLALARELVELHGGRIWAESATGRGARFYVELPRDRAHLRGELVDASATDGKDTRAPEAPARPDWTDNIANRDEFRLMEVAQATERRIVERDADERSRGRTILVVEDTPDVVRLIHLILRQQFRIFTAPDGKRGLELALREAPHLIITDLMMPEMDGYELTRALRANERTRHIPIVMLTARGEVEDRVQGLESGVSAYLTKPFAARELLTTVRKQLEVQDSTTDLVLTRQMDSMEIVAGGLAHEINNPLNYIKNSLARVRKDVDELVAAIAAGAVSESRVKALDTRMKAMFKTAESGIARILNTVDLMRRYSREGYSRVSRDHDLFTAARDVVELVLPATGRAVKVTTHFTGDGLVYCVPEEMHQLLTNLVQNAIEAAPDDGSGAVEVTGEAVDGEVTLSVRDNGPGVKPEDHARIFAPFYTTKAPGAGMGMGLTIAWRVVQALGGSLTEEGKYGEGACFVMRLPRSVRASRPRLSLLPGAVPPAA